MKAKPTYWELLLCKNWKDMKNFQTINEMSKVNVSIRHSPMNIDVSIYHTYYDKNFKIQCSLIRIIL